MCFCFRKNMCLLLYSMKYALQTLIWKLPRFMDPLLFFLFSGTVRLLLQSVAGCVAEHLASSWQPVAIKNLLVNEFWLFSMLSYSTVSSVGRQLSSVWTVLKCCYMKLIMCTEFEFQCCSDRLVLNIWHRKHTRHFNQLCYDLLWLDLYLHLPCITQSTDFLVIKGSSLCCLECVIRYTWLNMWKSVLWNYKNMFK